MSQPYTNLLIDLPFSQNRLLCQSFPSATSLEDAIHHVLSHRLPQLSVEQQSRYYLSFASGRPIHDHVYHRSLSSISESSCSESSTYLHFRFTPRLVGGKGGFGSQLRAQGGRMSKSRNSRNNGSSSLEYANNQDRQDALNDNFRTVDGRRYRSVRQAKVLAIHIDRAAKKRKEKAEEKRNKLERIIKNGNHKDSTEVREEDEHEGYQKSAKDIVKEYTSSNKSLTYDPEYDEDVTSLTQTVKDITKNLNGVISQSIPSPPESDGSDKDLKCAAKDKGKKPVKKGAFFDEELLSDSSDDE